VKIKFPQFSKVNEECGAISFLLAEINSNFIGTALAARNTPAFMLKCKPHY